MKRAVIHQNLTSPNYIDVWIVEGEKPSSVIIYTLQTSRIKDAYAVISEMQVPSGNVQCNIKLPETKITNK